MLNADKCWESEILLMTSLSRGFVADNIINGLLMIDFAKNHDN
jgi:hypothetical protein